MNPPPRYRILLLEDNPADAELFQESLHGTQRAAYDVDHVERTAEAAARLSVDHSYAAVVTDLNLPDTTGEDTIRTLRSADLRAPLIVLTGSVSRESGEWALALGADDYLSKGTLDPDVLDRTLRYAMERRRQRVLLEEAQHLARVGSFSWDLATNIIQRSTTFDRILEIPAEAARTSIKPYLDRIHADDRDRVEQEMRDAAAEGRRVEIEHRFERHEGPPGWGQLTLHVDAAPDGIPRTAHGTFQDLTERHARERDRAFLAAIVESTAEAVVGASPDGTITSWNGLAIARAIIKAHGGRIWGESQGPGKGATFGIELPLAAPPEGDRKPS